MGDRRSQNRSLRNKNLEALRVRDGLEADRPATPLVAQAVQRAASAQPLLASVVTHLSPHFLVPAPQVPTTQAPL